MIKKFLSIVSMLFLLANIANAGTTKWININSAKPAEATSKLILDNGSQTVVEFNLPGFDMKAVSANNLDAASIIPKAAGTTPLLIDGAPDLSKYAFSVIIPDNAKMKVDIENSSYIDYKDIKIAPSKGNLYRNTDPSTIPYVYGDSYKTNAFFPGKLAELQSPYILRDFRAQTVWLYPFQYNPVTKVLRVYYKLKVKIVNDGISNINVLQRKGTAKKIDKEMCAIYNSMFKNGGNNTINYAQVDEDGSILILAYNQFMSTLQPFVDWKIREGIHCEMIDAASAGATAVAIKTYIANYYNMHPELKYILIAGDAQQVPTPILSGGASDPSYGYLSGSDSYAEVFVGRFSAQNITDLQVQVQKVIDYEINPNLSLQHFNKGVVVASDQGPGDDGEMDWEHERIIRDKELTYTYMDIKELYDGTHPGGNDDPGDPSSADLFNKFQSGINVMTYTGHGSNNSCSTTGLSSSDVDNMTNYEMLPFIWSVACVNGNFNQGDCFAEAFLRAQSNGQPTGAIATFMSSINQSWNPPMDGQDEMVDLLVESYAANIKRTFGGLSINGCFHMNDAYGAAGDEMTDTWHVFGDPSLMVRTAPPTVISATHDAYISLNQSTFTLQCNKQNGALACLSNNGEILDVQPIVNGTATFNFNALIVLDTIQLTITGFNCKPYLTDLPVLLTGLDEQENNLSLSVFPNPANDMLTVTIKDFVSRTNNVEILSETGAQVMNLTFAENSSSIEVPTKKLSNGVYFIRYQNGNDICKKQFVVKH